MTEPLRYAFDGADARILIMTTDEWRKSPESLLTTWQAQIRGDVVVALSITLVAPGSERTESLERFTRRN